MSGKRTRHVGDVASRLRGLLARFVPGLSAAADSPTDSGDSAGLDVSGASADSRVDVRGDVRGGLHDDLYDDMPSQVALDAAGHAASEPAASTFVDTDDAERSAEPSTFVDGEPRDAEPLDNVAAASTFVERDSKTVGIAGNVASTFVERSSAESSSDASAASTFVDDEPSESDPSESDSADLTDPSDHSTPSATSAPSTPINPIAAPTTPDPDHSANPNGPTLPSLYTPLPLTATITPNPAATTPLTLTTWEHITGTDQEGLAERKAERRETRRSNFFGILSILLITVSALVIGTPFAMRASEQHQANSVSSQSAKTVAGWPYPKAKEALAAARAYNQRLAKTSQSVIGEAHDPFASESGGSKTSKEDDSLAAKDKEYQSLLDTGEGVMGTVRIPKISVNLPIYHGTSEDALARGVGHLYGTSLPAGGKNSHTVLTGHRGLVNAELFTRLDELRKGDYIYIDVMGETLGYKVDRISVIEPSDVSKLKVEPGKDRITLMTCTPYGVNTHRLLVSGLRGKIPHPIPDPDAAPKDVRAIAVRVALVAGGCVLAVWLWLGCLAPNRDRWMLIQHAGSRPDWM